MSEVKAKTRTVVQGGLTAGSRTFPEPRWGGVKNVLKRQLASATGIGLLYYTVCALSPTSHVTQSTGSNLRPSLIFLVNLLWYEVRCWCKINRYSNYCKTSASLVTFSLTNTYYQL